MNVCEHKQGSSKNERKVKEFRVTCVCKAGSGQTVIDITHVGNELDRWLMSSEMVIQHLEVGTAAFYVLDEQTGQRSSLGFAREDGRRPYLFSHIAGRCNAQLWALNVVAPGCQTFA